MTAGVNGHLAQWPKDLSGQRIELRNAVDKIAKKLQANGPILLMGRKDVHNIAAHAKRAAVKIDVVALVLNLH